MNWTTRLLTFALLLTVTTAPTAAAAQTGEAKGVVRVADHVGFWRDDHIRWRSTFELRPAVKEEFDQMVLVRPLGSEVEVVETSPESVAPVRDAEGRVTKIRLPEGQSAPWNVTMVVRQPVDGAGRLRPPLAGPRAPHRVTLRGAKFTPADGSGLREHPGFVATEAVGRDRRHRVEASFDEPADAADRPVFFRPVDLAGGALPGEAESVTVHKRRAVWVLGAALVLLAGIGTVVYRWLAGRAKEEEAEAILEEHGLEIPG